MSEMTLERRATVIATSTKIEWSLRNAALAAFVFACLAGASWYAYSWWTVGRFLESTDDAYVGGNITPLAPQVSGFISAIYVHDNDEVRKGQLLIQLDPGIYKAALDKAEALLQREKATLDNLRAKYALQQSTIAQAEADLSAKAAQAVYAAEESERYKALAATESGSRQNAQRTLAGNLSAQASVSAARAAVQAAKQQLAVLDTEIAETAAAVEAAKADTETATLNLAYTEVRSPIDGYIGNRAAQLGAYVQAGSYLVTVIPVQGLWVDANFKEDQLEHMRRGQQVLIVTDIFPRDQIHGRVNSLAPATGAVFSIIPPENATGNFTRIVQRVPVRIELDDARAGESRLRPGLSATVTVDTRPAQEPSK